MTTATLYLNPQGSYEDNVKKALETFDFLNETSAGNLVSWLDERPSMASTIEHKELMLLEGIVW